MVENKAHLSTTIVVGPITIDFTPPVYKGDIELTVDKEVIASWPSDAFYDAEDVSLISTYTWALGKSLCHFL